MAAPYSWAAAQRPARRRLVGSLADLPYVSRRSTGFIVPESVQALIGQDLVPTLLTSATVPRWWA